jgi:general secretion pathway protein E
MSQRLVRSICPECKAPVALSSEHITFFKDQLGLAPAQAQAFRGKGCRHCFFTGFRGRTIISELLVVGEGIRREIVMKATSSQIESAALRQGMRTMLQDGLEKVLRGLTTFEEVLEVCEDVEAPPVVVQGAPPVQPAPQA